MAYLWPCSHSTGVQQVFLNQALQLFNRHSTPIQQLFTMQAFNTYSTGIHHKGAYLGAAFFAGVGGYLWKCWNRPVGFSDRIKKAVPDEHQQAWPFIVLAGGNNELAELADTKKGFA